jgi:radical SAM protein with 4Fe4S-binding SPASM domain
MALRAYLDRFVESNWVNLWRTVHGIKRASGLPTPPVDVQWLATERCNLSCAHCGTNAGKKNPEELTTEEIKRAIDELALLGTELFQLTGGEPLLREDLWEVLEYAASRGLGYSMVTNGTFVPQFEKQFRKLPPEAIKVSVDGTPDTHNKIRGAENFHQCMTALSFFEDLGIRTRVLCTTLNQMNFPELEEMFRHVRASGANFWEFHLAVREGRAKANQDWMYLSKDQIAELFRFIILGRSVFNIFMGESCGYLGHYTLSLYNHRFFCGCGWNTFTIMPNGDISGCPAFEKEWVEGNIREHSLTHFWHHGFARFREKLELPEDCQKCDYLPACGGGCWMMRRTNDHCYKEIWEKGLFQESAR